ncbi:MAG TPA: hypothetical protein VIL70_07440, partial [Chthoniobacterales bacterium]
MKATQILCYDRATGTRLKADFGTPEFFAELKALRALKKSAHLPKGSLGETVRIYKEIGGFPALRPKTQLSYERVFKILDPLRAVKMAEMTRPQILTLRNEEYLPKYGRW